MWSRPDVYEPINYSQYRFWLGKTNAKFYHVLTLKRNEFTTVHDFVRHCKNVSFDYMAYHNPKNIDKTKVQPLTLKDFNVSHVIKIKHNGKYWFMVFSTNYKVFKLYFVEV